MGNRPKYTFSSVMVRFCTFSSIIDFWASSRKRAATVGATAISRFFARLRLASGSAPAPPPISRSSSSSSLDPPSLGDFLKL